MPHYCKYLIAHCIDFRLQKAIKNYLEKNGILGNCDIVSAAGGVKNTDFLLEQVDVSLRLHKIHEAILLNHTDCGAYGGSAKFSSLEEERNFHVGELKKVKDAVLAEYPSLKVKMLLAKITPSDEVSFEEIKEVKLP